MNLMKRRLALKYLAAGGAALAVPQWTFSQRMQMSTRIIPSSGEKVGMIGLGTWQTFDVNVSAANREPLKEVLRTLVRYGGNVVDSSPMYGRAEEVVGTLGAELGIQDQLFQATKVWTIGKQAGIDQMHRSMKRMHKAPIDLMQVHNLQDWKTHLKTLQEWKAAGKLRYIGITHYTDSSHRHLQNIVETEDIDFLQVNYSINNRNAEDALLPAARDNGVAVIINRPYSGGSLFRKTKNRELPTLAKEIQCASWGQFFLKYLLSNPAVTCVIPGTSKPHHMLDNVKAGIGLLPDQTQRERMVTYIESL